MDQVIGVPSGEEPSTRNLYFGNFSELGTLGSVALVKIENTKKIPVSRFYNLKTNQIALFPRYSANYDAIKSIKLYELLSRCPFLQHFRKIQNDRKWTLLLPIDLRTITFWYAGKGNLLLPQRCKVCIVAGWHGKRQHHAFRRTSRRYQRDVAATKLQSLFLESQYKKICAIRSTLVRKADHPQTSRSKQRPNIKQQLL